MQAHNSPAGPPTSSEVAQYMAENGDLLEAAHERLCLGRLHESLQYQAQLQQNLIYLATHADDDPSLMPLQYHGPPQNQADDEEDADAPDAEAAPEATTAEAPANIDREPEPAAAAPVAPQTFAERQAEDTELLEDMLRRRSKRRREAMDRGAGTS